MKGLPALPAEALPRTLQRCAARSHLHVQGVMSGHSAKILFAKLVPQLTIFC